MNVKDFRAKAYTKNAEGIPVPVNETPSVQKSENNFQKTVFTKDIKAEDLTQKKQSPSQALDNTVDYLKTGGLLKVPVEQTPDGKDSVYRRVAKFLLLIGEDEAAKILPHLSESQIEKIIPEIASIRTVSKEEAAVIMEEFNGLLNKAREEGGVETAREMLEKAYGKKRADELLKKAMPLEGKVPFTYLRDADNERVYLLIKDENPGVQSMVLSHLNPKKAAKIINLMTPEEKKEVVMRLAKMEPVSPDVLRRVDQAMHEKSLNQTVEKAENIDGRNALAQILKKMDAGAENDILTYLSEDDPDLGQDLRSRLFTMDDVVKSDDRFVQEKLREMTEIDIAYLIAAKPDDFREKILSNISAGRRAEVRAQEDILKPMRRSDCERITSEFFSKLRRAFEEGHLIIKDRNDDVFV
ncbi:flagellar motor switch protein FliG [Treponema bryantii]|uniref:Flagellar motor switch protein FliG n=1 Tax=Treponema bryantii TaxID=163 RepID=A0A1H8ZQN4_9SPIR|nr:flagellar motor switch protein FliG [Treponema bryantii]SEP66722.1 flagellar motor switch protein FliG [Treponema bryantii]